MNIRRGLLIHPDELSEKWTDRVCSSKLSFFGLHPVGGGKANESMASLIGDLDVINPRLERIVKSGVAVEHEMHALRWMLPADMFDKHPDWYRMDENGARVSDYNLCPSNKDALDYISERAAEAASLLPSSSHRYHFWIDDVWKAHCSCPECKRYTNSDQAMIIYNAIVNGLRRTDPDAKQCYLSYHSTLEAPKSVEPADGIYLEFAPMVRDFDIPIGDPSSEKNGAQICVLDDLFAYFGKADSTACEYWLDNSRYSKYTKPPVAFPYNSEVTRADLEFYEAKGFEYATTFACYLGPDYEEHNGEPPVDEYLNMK